MLLTLIRKARRCLVSRILLEWSSAAETLEGWGWVGACGRPTREIPVRGVGYEPGVFVTPEPNLSIVH